MSTVYPSLQMIRFFLFLAFSFTVEDYSALKLYTPQVPYLLEFSVKEPFLHEKMDMKKIPHSCQKVS